MRFENARSAGGCGLPQNVALGAAGQGQAGPHPRGQAGQAVGLPGGRSCLLSALALFWVWARTAKWL